MITDRGRCPLQLLHQGGQHDVFAQDWSLAEAPATLGTGVGRLLVPVALEAVHAVAVSTGDGNGLLQHVQTDGTGQGLCHFTVSQNCGTKNTLNVPASLLE